MKPALISFSYLNPSLLRRQPLSGACRPLTSFGSGVPAASMFSEHLAYADDAALMRLDIFFFCPLRDQKKPHFVDRTPFVRPMRDQFPMVAGGHNDS